MEDPIVVVVMPRGLTIFGYSVLKAIVSRWTGDKGLLIFMIPMLSVALLDTMTYVKLFIVKMCE